MCTIVCINQKSFTVNNLQSFISLSGAYRSRTDDLLTASQTINRGVAKHFLKDTQGACKDWHKAGKLGFDEAYVLIKQFCN